MAPQARQIRFRENWWSPHSGQFQSPGNIGWVLTSGLPCVAFLPRSLHLPPVPKLPPVSTTAHCAAPFSLPPHPS
eukprot:NODE_20934_length_776_cov_2.611710.p2 GENE.NODE_20934_length_776_cov_2.611710~~NODE_20934_length_776_cov_2.611710.p2  ORF type:complete len:75 (-),score=2.02 NODE_20934_length_776_cov_2.611710:162-386(-)